MTSAEAFLTPLTADTYRRLNECRPKETQPVKILSVDAETNGLHGQPFAIGAMLTGHGGAVQAIYEARCAIDGPVDPWVAANVLPALTTAEMFPGDANPYPLMLASFAAWFDAHKDGAVVIAHVGVPVEAGLFADMVHVLGRDPFSGPFPLHDLATLLYAVGADPLSADGYRTAHGLRMAAAYEAMSPHNPLYDAAVAEACWRHLTTSRVERTHYGPPGYLTDQLIRTTAENAALATALDQVTHEARPGYVEDEMGQVCVKPMGLVGFPCRSPLDSREHHTSARVRAELEGTE